MDNEKVKLRRSDLFTSIVLFLLGLWIIFEAFKMPIKDSYAGVKNVWYVSPALFPLIIGFALMILSVFLFKVAVNAVGISYLKKGLTKLIKFKMEERDLKFIAILSLFAFYVYLFIPRVDFFVSTALFLMVFISIFYFEDLDLFKRLYRFFMTGSLVLLVFFLFKLNRLLDESIFIYMTDLLVIAFFILYCSYAFILTIKDNRLKLRYRTSIIVAIVVPLLISPIFKYFLKVILPTEGLVIEVMNIIRYSVFK